VDSVKKKLTRAQKRLINEEKEKLYSATFLAPIGIQKAKKNSQPPRRKGFLSLTLNEYIQLVDATGRMLRKGKRGQIPSELAPILNRFEIQTDEWLKTIKTFGKMFYRVVGKVEKIMEAAKRAGRNWLKGVTSAAKVFG